MDVSIYNSPPRNTSSVNDTALKRSLGCRGSGDHNDDDYDNDDAVIDNVGARTRVTTTYVTHDDNKAVTLKTAGCSRFPVVYEAERIPI